MKIAIASDIHLEFGPITLKNTEDADILVLAGDICVAKDVMFEDDGMPTSTSKMLHAFFKRVTSEFPVVLYVMGNHEHYHGDIAKTVPHLRARLDYLPNLSILDKQVFRAGDTTFIGSTLWTDMNKGDYVTLHATRDMMSDYTYTKNSGSMVEEKILDYKAMGVSALEWHASSSLRDPKLQQIKKIWTRKLTPGKLTPQWTMEEHDRCLQYIAQVVAGKPEEKFVVIGHHSPSHMSIESNYLNARVMNGAYHSDLSEFMLDRPQIKLWIHGHTHHNFDYEIGDTRIVCNPRGYTGHEYQASKFQLKYVEV